MREIAGIPVKTLPEFLENARKTTDIPVQRPMQSLWGR
jgi:hypothetical protein